MQELKEAYASTTNYRKRLSILTLSPYTIDTTARFFGASIYMVKRARLLRQSSGVLADSGKDSRGHRTTEMDKRKVETFYMSDEVSRMMPGKKDYVTIRRGDGHKEKVQKRLVLGTLREIYQLYKKDETNPKIGFSRFAALRPRNCVLAGSAGTHSVCVCTYHQNPKLLAAALGLGNLTLDDLFEHCVCDKNLRECMMAACNDCPGEDGVYHFLKTATRRDGRADSGSRGGGDEGGGSGGWDREGGGDGGGGSGSGGGGSGGGDGEGGGAGGDGDGSSDHDTDGGDGDGGSESHAGSGDSGDGGDVGGDIAVSQDDDDDDDDDYDAEVRYKQWVTTDRCTLEERIERHDDCLRSLSKQIRTLTVHHFRAQTQSAYFARMKETVPDGEVIVHGDFSENLAFIAQDAAQGFHWDRSQCTLHPFVAYWRTGGELRHKSFCCICADMKHDPAMVHVFSTEVLKRIKTLVPCVTKIHYFTDGCAAQYKNRFNFVNICHHEEDFGLKCEWNFFATSHGKGACDGIGGTVKRAAYQESLRRPYANQILDVDTLYQYLNDFSSTIEIIHVHSSKVADVRRATKARFADAVVIRGTQRYHRYVPVSQDSISVHELSVDPGHTVRVKRRRN